MFFKNNPLLVILFFSLSIIQISSDDVTDAQSPVYVVETLVYINQGPGSFYDYTVLTNGNIRIDITDQDLNSYSLKFQNINGFNDIYFRAAYYKFIIVEEIYQNQKFYYWILEIVKTENGFDLKNFSVNSKVDNQGFQLDNSIVFSGILEYNQFTNFLYIILQNQIVNVYGIDIENQGYNLISISRYLSTYQNSAVFIGGNSRALIQASKDQLWIDIRNIRRDSQEYTIFNKTDIQDLTRLPIYPGGSSVYHHIDTYFEYISITEDFMKMTAFLYHGYGDQKIQGEVSFISLESIIIFSDSYNFFIAISDHDIYLTIVQWNDNSKNYTVFSNTLQNVVTDKSTYQQTINNFKSATGIIYNNHKVYFYTIDKFYVYSGKTYFSKLYETIIIPNPDYSSLYDIMISQIKLYEDMQK